MNAKRWRILFNRSRRMLVVVSDIARAAVAGSGSRAGGVPITGLPLRALCFAVLLACGLVQTAAFASEIRPDPRAPAGQQATVLKTADGLPQVNIRTPGSGGVSVNQFSRFDVDNRGVIINNARTQAPTQLAGWVTANPWLARGEAKIIVSQVNSARPSQLNGQLEIAGKRAQFIMANPAGIQCDGCGFINAGRATLTTGQLQMRDARIAGYDIQRGTVSVGPGGLNARDTDYTAILARAVQLNGQIQAQELHLTAGRNHITEPPESGSPAVTPLADNGSAKPRFALDASQLGGMYAGKIFLTATEKGVGVNTQGDIAASAGSFLLSADGDIINTATVRAAQHISLTSASGGVQNKGDIAAAGKLDLRAAQTVNNQGRLTGADVHLATPADIINSGQITAQHNARLDSAASLRHSGSLLAGQDIRISAAQAVQADSGSLLAAGVRGGQPAARGSILLHTAALTSHGTLTAGGDIRLTATQADLSRSTAQAADILISASRGSITTSHARLIADNRLTLSSPQALISRYGQLQAGQLTLTGSQLDNRHGTLIQTGSGDLTLHFRDGTDNSAGTLAVNSQNLSLLTPVLNNRQGHIIHAGSGTFTLSAADTDSTRGSLDSNGQLALNVSNLTLDSAALNVAQLTFSGHHLSARNARLSGGEIRLSLTGTLDNHGGHIRSRSTLDISAARTDNRTGTLHSGGSLRLSGGALDNSGGLIQSGGTLTISTAGAELSNADSNTDSGKTGGILAQGSISLDTGELNNSAGLIQSGGDLTLNTHNASLNNRNSGSTGGILATGNITLTSGEMNNSDGLIQSGGELSVDTGTDALSNSGTGTTGGILAKGNVTLSTGELNNSAGLIQSGGTLDISTHEQRLTSAAGRILAQDNLTLHTGTLNNTAGLIQTGSELIIDTAGNALTNSHSGTTGGILAKGNVTLRTGELTSNAGLIQSGDSLDISTHEHRFSTTSGTVLAQNNLTLDTGDLDNTSGLIQSGNGLTLNTHNASLTNTRSGTSGGILAQNSITLLTGELNNSDGLIQSGGELTVDTGTDTLTNSHSGTTGGILAKGNATLSTGELNNSDGLIQSGGTLDISTHEQRLTSAAGRILAQDNLILNTGIVDNTAGLIQSGSGLTLNTHNASLTNTRSGTSGGILAQNSITLSTGELNNSTGLIQSGGELTVDTGTDALTNSHSGTTGGILAKGNVTLRTGELTSNAGLIQSGDSLDISTHEHRFSTTTGTVLAQNDITLDTGDLDNTAGLIQSGSELSLNTHNASLTNSNSGTTGGILAKGNATLRTGELTSNAGLIQSGNALTLNTHNASLTNINSGTSGGILAQNSITLLTGELNNSDGLIQSGGTLDISTHEQRLTSAAGRILAQDNLILNTGIVDNTAGLIQSGSGLTLNTHNASLTNINSGTSGGILAQNSITLSTGELNNSTGLIQSGGELTVDTGTDALTNSHSGTTGGILAKGNATLRTGELNNNAGLIQSNDSLNISTHEHRFSTTAGTVLAQHNLTLNTGALDNTSGLIQSGNGLTLNTHNASLTNTRSGTSGGILAQNSITLSTGELNNSTGLIQSGGELTVDTGTATLINSHSGTTGGILAKGNATLSTGELNNNAGLIQSGDSLDISTHEHRFSTTSGTVLAQHNLTLHTGALNNTAGLIQTGSELIIDTAGNALTNSNSGTTGGILAKGNATLSTGELNNSTGLIQSGGELTVDTGTATLINSNSGTTSGILAKGNATLSTGELNNNAGLIQSNDSLNISTHEHRFSTTSGTVLAQHNLTLHTGALDNTAGLIQTGGELSLNTHNASLTNLNSGTTGGILAKGSATLTTGLFDNSAGSITAGSLSLLTQRFTNRHGQIRTPGSLSLNNRGQLLDNRSGHILSGGQAVLSGGALDNRQGLIRGGGLQLERSSDISNRQGSLLSSDTLTLSGGTLDNHQGQLQAVKDIRLTLSGSTDNTAGLVRSGSRLTARAVQWLNSDTGGTNQGLEAAAIQLTAALLDNSGGAIRAVSDIVLSISSRLNNQTGRISGGTDVTVQGDTLSLNNSSGDISAGQSLNLHSDTLTPGTLRARHTLRLSLQQDFTSTDRLLADGDLYISLPGTLTNRGQLQAAGTLSVSAGVLNNTASGRIISRQTLLNTGALNNQGLTDGDELTHIRTTSLTNSDGGRIYGGHIAIQADTLDNMPEPPEERQKREAAEKARAEREAAEKDGTVSDGAADSLPLAAGADIPVSGPEKSRRSPVIAARERLDLGVRTLNNRDGAEILSLGDMAVAGQTDSRLHATGQAGQINNTNATLSADGSLSVSAAELNNLNGGLTTKVVTVIRDESHHELRFSGTSNRYLWDSILNREYSKYGVLTVTAPDGSRGEDFYEYDYRRTVTEQQVAESHPGQILSGGDMLLSGGTVNNRDSRIIAGGTLRAVVEKLNNDATPGERIITDRGGQAHWFRKVDHFLFGNKTSQGKDYDGYSPVPVIQHPDLQVLKWQGSGSHSAPSPLPGTAVTAAGVSLPLTGAVSAGEAPPAAVLNAAHPLQALSVSDTAALSTQPLRLPPGTLAEIPLLRPLNGRALTAAPVSTPAGPGAPAAVTPRPARTGLSPDRPDSPDSPDTAGGPAAAITAVVIRLVSPDIRLPHSALFQINPAAPLGYLVETDPDFTQRKPWLGTDYMQHEMAYSPAATTKRLGDGYYEQRLVRSQIIQLTGQRYLPGYHSDEEQFKALMNAGIAFAREFHISPGIALSPQQMQLLTSDILWLTEETVTLADGTTVQVLVPQVYSLHTPGDTTGGTGIISGRSVQLSVNGDLNNSGTLAATDSLSATALNLNNRGLIQAGQAELAALNDLLNDGGTVHTTTALSLRAGHDLTLRTTTYDVSTESLSGGGFLYRPRRYQEYHRYTDRLAEVSAGGALQLAAGRDLTLTAATVRGSDVRLLAGRDLRLNTLTTLHTENRDRNADNYSHLSQQREQGSDISGQHSVTLQAGRILEATAARLSTPGALSLSAADDLLIQAGTALSEAADHSTQSSHSLFSRYTTQHHDETRRRGAVSTELTGGTVSLQAGHDLHIRGSDIAGSRDVTLVAGRTLDITTTDTASHEYHLREEKSSGILGGGGGITFGSRKEKTTADTDSRTEYASTLTSTGGSLSLLAGQNLNLHASDLAAAQDIRLSAANIRITAGENLLNSTQTRDFRQHGVSVALSHSSGGLFSQIKQTDQALWHKGRNRPDAGKGLQTALNDAPTEAGKQHLSGANPLSNFSAGLRLSYGSQSEHDEQHTEIHQVSPATLTAGRHIRITAADSLTLQAAQLASGRDTVLAAGNNLTLSAALNTEQHQQHSSTHHSGIGISLEAGDGGPQMRLSGADGSEQLAHHSHRHDSLTTVTPQGTQIHSGGDLLLSAGADLHTSAAQINAQGSAVLLAGRDLTLEHLTGYHDSHSDTDSSDSSFFTRTEKEDTEHSAQQRIHGTAVDAERLTLSAGRQLTVQASSVTAQQDVLLNAQSLNITSAQGSYQQQQQHKRTDSGLLDTGGIGFMVGSRTQNNGGSDAGRLEYGSTLGSTQGSVILSAADDLNIRSSDLISGKDIRLTGKNVRISSGENIQTALRTQEFHQAGVTVALSGSAGGALNSAVQAAQQAEQEPDGRLKALKTLKAALSGVQAAQSVRMAQSNPADGNLIGVSVSLGAQTASAEQYSESHSATPAALNAGRDIIITATGGAAAATGDKTTGNGKPENGDITIQGSTLKAVRDTQLTAANDISLLSAANSHSLTGSNNSHGGSIGVSFGVGQNGFGFSIDASASSAHGAENGNGTSQQLTTTDSGRNLTINAGHDTTLQGAQASAEHISLTTGNNLTLSSEQDTDHYHSGQYSMSAGVSIPVFGYKTGSASVSASRDKLHSDYNSVTQQTGLFAGSGGFDIHTGNHTQLNGAVIASTADKSKNILDTGTLGFSNIQNEAAYDVQHQGVSLSTGNPLSTAMSAAGSLAGANHSDSAASTTYAAVSDGTIIIRDPAHQKQSVSELSRDTDHAANGLSPLFNKENELKRLQTVQLLSDIGSQVSDIALTEGKIRAAQKAKAQAENASQTERSKARATLTAEANARAAKTGKSAETISEAAVTQKIYSDYYNRALTESGFGTGGKYQQAITAVTAAVQGLITHNPGAALAGAAAPYIATEIKRLTTDEHNHQNTAVALLAHATASAALAIASGEGKQGALAAAGGAATGEATAIIASQAFHKPVSELSEEEKQTVSTLATLASGLAGVLITDSGTGTIAAAQAGKITAENNGLRAEIAEVAGKQAVKLCAGNPACRDGAMAMGLSSAMLLTAEQIKEATDAGVSRDPRKISLLTPEQLDWLDTQIREQKGMAVLMFGTQTWGERIVLSGEHSSEDKTPNAPNIAKNLNAQDKAELGGAGSGTPGGFEPEDKDTKKLTTSDRRSIRSLEKRIQEHKEKLEEYKRNPDLFDNKEYLENASGEDVRKEIINGRIRHLEKEIQTFEKNINDIKNRSK